MKKRLILSMIAVMFISMFCIALIPNNSDDNPNDVSITYNSNVCISTTGDFEGRETPLGGIELIQCEHNLLYNSGKNLIRTYLSDTGSIDDEIDWIELCNATAGCGTPQANNGETYNAIASCGLQKSAGTYVAGGTGNWSISHQFTSSCDNLATNVTRLLNEEADIFAGNSFPEVNLMSDDQLLINWTLSVN